MLTGKMWEIAVSFQKGLLHQVRGIALGAQMPTKLRLRQEAKIMAVALKELLACVRFTPAAALNQLGYRQVARHALSLAILKPMRAKDAAWKALFCQADEVLVMCEEEYLGPRRQFSKCL